MYFSSSYNAFRFPPLSTRIRYTPDIVVLSALKKAAPPAPASPAFTPGFQKINFDCFIYSLAIIV